MTSFRIIIPARYQSSRFPGKALCEIAGKTMIERVYQQAIQSGAASTVIATDDERIAECAKNFGAEVCMTDPKHDNGTERLAEAIRKLNYKDDEIIVNVQGDEPLIPPSIIRQVADNLALKKEADITTLYKPITEIEKLFDINVVKVVLDREGYALYFSRAPIPWVRDSFPKSLPKQVSHYHHIGIYAYRAAFVQEYVSWDRSPIEQLEQVEQLRALWYGKRIHLDLAKEFPAMDVNTPEDLEKIKKLFS
ncbi:MAG: 3-deoxy-manno-octulosonate cytidylyltransferase [Proteobacteria bacterium]|nr:3-deoxy-manno-octulosonate cytidylyltransferase [Pseudomonadota bacterium]